MLEAYFKANALYPKTNKFVGVSSLKVYQGLPRNAGLPFLVIKILLNNNKAYFNFLYKVESAYIHSRKPT